MTETAYNDLTSLRALEIAHALIPRQMDSTYPQREEKRHWHRFYLGADHVITCAHVVNSALEKSFTAVESPTAPIHLNFALIPAARHRSYTATVTDAWLPMTDEGGDIAVLTLGDHAPDEACAPALGKAAGDMWGKECRIFGFHVPEGGSAEGIIRIRQGTGLLQVDAKPDSQFFVEPGFSGAPGWDAEERLLGMITTREIRPDVRVGYLIPVETLAAAYPPLRRGSHVFISYSRVDTPFVERLERDLNARGIATWRDTSSIVGGEEWYAAIVAGIDGAYAVVQIVTAASNESKWVRREALYADQLGRPIIPLVPRNQGQILPFNLIDAQPIYCDHYETGLEQLLRALDLPRAPSAPAPRPAVERAPSLRDRELAYLDFLLAEMKAERRSALYVSLGADQERPARPVPSPRQADSAFGFPDEFKLSFDRLDHMERVRADALDRPGEPVKDARIPLREMQRVLLLGKPGSGKTTTLQQLTIEMAYEARGDASKPLPVFVPLSKYQGAEPFADFVRQWLFTLQTEYDRLLEDGRLVLCFDALNEMNRSGHERDLVAEVRAYLQAVRPWIVSCRERDYDEADLGQIPDLGLVRLRPLDLPRIKEVIDRRFSAEPAKAAALWEDLKGSDDLLAAWQAFEAAGQAEAFWTANQWPDGLRLSWFSRPGDAWDAMRRDRRRMLELCRNPFLLYMVCGVFQREGRLPPNRGRLFATFVDNLLDKEEESSRATGRPWIDRRIITQALAQIAFAMQTGKTGTEIPRKDAERILQELPDVPDPALLLRLAASASLIDAGDQVRFTHQLLQEYFASEIMGAAMDAGRSPTEFWPATAWWERQGWEETATILAGVRGDPEGVARWLAPAQPEVAYHALTECGIEVDLQDLKPETRAALIQGAEQKTSESNAIGRAAAYRVLGHLKADLRRGTGLRAAGVPDIAWSKTIEPGPFRMGGDRQAWNAWAGAEFTLDYPFWLARYPVTYAQYEAFIEVGGYREHHYWTAAGWAWKGSREYPEYGWHDPRWHIANHPVVGVTWYEAWAFTQWLDEVCQQGGLALPAGAPEGWTIRLPTEAEWEKAARYPGGRKFPWGDEPDPGRMNTSESGIGRTSAVGIFPNGTGPAEAYDLSGNVWEWCLSRWSGDYHFPEGNNPEDDDARVLRGGSWGLSVHDARGASRGGSDPIVRYDLIGFRVVCSAPMA